jgi:hypothetical protein
VDLNEALSEVNAVLSQRLRRYKRMWLVSWVPYLAAVAVLEGVWGARKDLALHFRPILAILFVTFLMLCWVCVLVMNPFVYRLFLARRCGWSALSAAVRFQE